MKKSIIVMILGTIMTALGLIMFGNRQKVRFDKPLAWGVAGFGLAHILLGAIDYAMEQKEEEEETLELLRN